MTTMRICDYHYLNTNFVIYLKKKKTTTNLKYKFPLATKDAPEFLLLVTCQ